MPFYGRGWHKARGESPLGVARGFCFELSATVFADSDASQTVTTQCLADILLRHDCCPVIAPNVQVSHFLSQYPPIVSTQDLLVYEYAMRDSFQDPPFKPDETIGLADIFATKCK